jgi:hypothetical protein
MHPWVLAIPLPLFTADLTARIRYGGIEVHDKATASQDEEMGDGHWHRLRAV